MNPRGREAASEGEDPPNVNTHPPYPTPYASGPVVVYLDLSGEGGRLRGAGWPSYPHPLDLAANHALMGPLRDKATNGRTTGERDACIGMRAA